MAPCEHYIQPAIDRAPTRSGLDGYFFGGFDDRRSVFASWRGRHLWSYDRPSAAWTFLG